MGGLACWRNAPRLLAAAVAVSCALAGAAQADDRRASALAGSVGGLSFGLVVQGSGSWPLDMVFADSARRSGSAWLYGAQTGYGFSLPMSGGAGTAPAGWLEFGGSFATASGAIRSVSRDGGGGKMQMNAGVRPDGRIRLQTRTGADGALAKGRVRVSDPAGGNVTITGSAFSPIGGGAKISQFAFSPTGNSAAFLALTTDGDALTASAYGAIYDPGGFQFVATGDLEGTIVDEWISESASIDSHNMLVSRPLPSAGSWSVTVRAGPTLRRMSRRAVISTGIEIRPTVPGASLPSLDITQRDAISVGYAGALAGLGLSRALNPRTRLSIDLRGGLAVLRGSHMRRAEVRIGALGAGEHVEQAQRVSGHSGLASLAVSLSHNPAPNTALSLNLFGEHVTHVPTLKATGNGAGRSLSLGSRSMTGFGVGIRLSRRF